MSRGIRGEVVCGAEVVNSGRARFRRATMALLPEARSSEMTVQREVL